MAFSIVIPTLNEADNIEKCLDFAIEGSPNYAVEIIIIDAGSVDHTCELVSKYPNVTLIQSPELKGLKYASLNKGAAVANGEVIIFLDADTWLPCNYSQLIVSKLTDEKVVGGAFEHSFDVSTPFLKLVQLINRIRYRISHRHYGDQAVFCRKSTFEKIGGYPEIKIMESARFCVKMKQVGKVSLIKTPIITSSRRFLENGQLTVFLNDVLIWMMDLLGVGLAKKGEAYWKYNQRNN